VKPGAHRNVSRADYVWSRLEETLYQVYISIYLDSNLFPSLAAPLPKHQAHTPVPVVALSIGSKSIDAFACDATLYTALEKNENKPTTGRQESNLPNKTLLQHVSRFTRRRRNGGVFPRLQPPLLTYDGTCPYCGGGPVGGV
jgi:hypothetical protein